MQRRQLLQAGLSLGALSTTAILPKAAARAPLPLDAGDWSSIRDQFALSRSWTHMSMFLLASHPRPVAEAIERHRRGLDENPAVYLQGHRLELQTAVREAAASYMGGSADRIALTDSTTMGLGLLYGTLDMRPDQEAVCTTHCHYATQMSLQHRAEHTGAKVRHVSLYADPAQVSVDEVVANTRRAITDKTRVLAVTWVHSCTGVKIPIRAMSEVVAEINAERAPDDRVIFCVDGVHGFGIEDQSIDELGCDFFVAGTHKWIFGPRGTGVLWAREGAWEAAAPVIPSFGMNGGVWRGQLEAADVTQGDLMTPGGFHSFEHRWALKEAFEFHLQLGKARVQARIHELNSRMKAAMSEMSHVKLHTPLRPELSAGIICFEVDGLEPVKVKERFLGEKIVASVSPYRVTYPRLAPSLINDEDEVDRAMKVLRAMA